MAGIHNFTIDAGTDFTIDFIYKDSAGVVIDLTGYTARMDFRRRYTDAAAAKSMTTESGHIAITGAAGKVTVTIPDDETDDLTSAYLYDLEIIDTGDTGDVTRLIEGKATIGAEVTK